jgi:subtilisin family serine protease
MKKLLALFLTVTFCFVVSQLTPQSQNKAFTGQETNLKFRKYLNAIPNRYIVVFKPDIAKQDIAGLTDNFANAFGGVVTHVYDQALKGFSVKLPESAAIALSKNPLVDHVSEDFEVHTITTQYNAPWNLDRTDQRSPSVPPTAYTYNYTGAGVNAYVIDTGVRVTHHEFGSRASVATDTVDDDGMPNNDDHDFFGPLGQPLDGLDQHGHGTRVAGLIGSNTFGVAKGVNIRSIRALDRNGRGLASDVIAAVNWVTTNRINPAVVNMSLAFTEPYQEPGVTLNDLDNAVRNSIASGVIYVIGAGNGDMNLVPQNANTASPARVTEAITVSAIDNADNRSSYANYGSVVDIFAPGGDFSADPNNRIAEGLAIRSTDFADDDATALDLGTSMAAPHVTGVAALVLQARPGIGSNQVAYIVAGEIKKNSTFGAIPNANPNNNPGANTPNRIVYSLIGAAPSSPAGTVPLYRYFSLGATDHFYTTDWNELGSGRLGYEFDWVQCRIFSQQQSGRTALYRYYNATTGDHFYTTNYSELGGGAQGYNFEWVQGYVYSTQQPGTVPLYRYWNPITYDHLYTTNWNELGNGRDGYNFEWVQCYVYQY